MAQDVGRQAPQHLRLVPDCGCEARKEVIFLHGGASSMDVAVLLGVPVGFLIYLFLKGRK